ncbi:hypothetical protein CAEBREN_17412 [Caenorhabditis brenneri]|uniref:DDE-1 domain-containing protein n=1 Tax=Caenorhabditis brenneri TaxID=135651 RepID=G0NBA8_CAEBE|nr:hypothetical protein CAEBREN_17412 [Caenorhabditis brenneri]
MEDWNSITKIDSELTNQAVFALMHIVVRKFNNHPNKRNHVSLVHPDYLVAKDLAISTHSSLPNIKEYLFFDQCHNQCYILPCLRRKHFGILFFDQFTNAIHYADSLLRFDFTDQEVQEIALDLGFPHKKVKHLTHSKIQLQSDNTSCGIFCVLYCEQFCKHGTVWALSNVNVGAVRQQFFEALRNSEFSGTSHSFAEENKRKRGRPSALKTIKSDKENRAIDVPISVKGNFPPNFINRPGRPALNKTWPLKTNRFENERSRGRPPKLLSVVDDEEKCSKPLAAQKTRGRPITNPVGRPKRKSSTPEGVRPHKKLGIEIEETAVSSDKKEDGFVNSLQLLLKKYMHQLEEQSEREKQKLLNRIESVVVDHLITESSSSSAAVSSSYDDEDLKIEEKANSTRLDFSKKKSLIAAYLGQRETLERLIKRFGLSSNEQYARVQIKRIEKEVLSNKPNRRQAYEMLSERVKEIIEYADDVEMIDLHDTDIVRAGFEQSICFGINDFKGSKFWTQGMKDKIGLKSRHIDARIPMTEKKKEPSIDEKIKQFREQEVERIRKQYPLDRIFNCDQTAIRYEMVRNRSLTKVGRAKLFRRSQNKNSTTHSFTLQPCISADGKITGRTFVTLCERIPPKSFAKMTAPFTKLYVTHSYSGFMSSKLACEWMLKVFLPAAPNNSVLLLDSWNGFIQMSKLPEVRRKNIEICVFPKKTTGELQPLDISFNRQFKNFVHKLESQIRYKAKHINISKRETKLKILEFAMDQFAAPRFNGLICRGFCKLGVNRTPQSYYENPDQYCFKPSATSKTLCQTCRKLAFCKCGWCAKTYCVVCAIHHRH